MPSCHPFGLDFPLWVSLSIFPILGLNGINESPRSAWNAGLWLQVLHELGNWDAETSSWHVGREAGHQRTGSDALVGKGKQKE